MNAAEQVTVPLSRPRGRRSNTAPDDFETAEGEYTFNHVIVPADYASPRTLGHGVLHADTILLHLRHQRAQLEQGMADMNNFGEVCRRPRHLLTDHEMMALLDEQIIETDEAVAYTIDDKQQRIVDVRDQIATVEPDLRWRIEENLDAMMPPFLMRTIQHMGVTWHDWMTSGVDDGGLVNVLQANAHIVGEQQSSPGFELMVRERKQLFGLSIQTLVEHGVLAQRALELLPMLDTISVSVGDIFDTYTKGRTGYHEFGSSTVVITQGCGNNNDRRMESLRDSVQSNLIHELIHAFFDVDAVYGDSHPMRSRWIQEGLTTILDETIRELNNEFISDDDRSVYSHEKETLYQLDRSFDQNLKSLSPVIILLLRAFSGGEQEFAQLQHWIDEEWSSCSPDRLSYIGDSMREVDNARGLPEYY